ncbi:MAG: hypothetical protein HYV95_04790 [Opitutae bacterium]|nr:hypothetical protein [Opitutae bacterium]
MSDSTPSPGPAEKFGAWLRRESWHALKLGAGLLAAGLALVYTLDACWPGFSAPWQRMNYQLTHTALEQHPLALVRTFGTRLGASEYGWGVLAWAEPFNVTAAGAELRSRYPEFIGVRDGEVVTRHTSLLKRGDAQHQETQAKRAADYLALYRQIESHRFMRVYGGTDVFSPPDANAELGQVVTKLLGLPDALLHTARHIVAGGIMSALLFCAVLAFAAVALWQSHRPARRGLKLLVWPVLASALVWLAIVAMSLGALLGGVFTPNTSALALLAAAPFLLLGAKVPLRLAEDLAFKPKPWDGIERRKPRAPPAA